MSGVKLDGVDVHVGFNVSRYLPRRWLVADQLVDLVPDILRHSRASFLFQGSGISRPTLTPVAERETYRYKHRVWAAGIVREERLLRALRASRRVKGRVRGSVVAGDVVR